MQFNQEFLAARDETDKENTFKGGGYERSVFTQFCNSPAPSILAEKVNLFSSGAMKLNTVMANQEWKSMKPVNSQSFNATEPLSSTAKCNSFKPSNFSNFKGFLAKKLGDEDDLRVPSNSQLNRDRKFKLRKGSNPGDLRSRLFVRNQIEDNVKVFQPRQDLVERSASITSNRDRNLVDAYSGWPLKVTSFKSLKRTYSSMMNQETRSNSMEILKALHGTNVQLNQEFLAARDETDKENTFKVRTESMSLGDDNSSPKNGLENGRECGGHKNGKPVKVRKVQKLIARSPHLLLDDQLYMNKPHLDMSLVKKLPPKSILEASPQIIVKPKDNSQKPDLRMECEDENAVGNLPLPSINNDTSKGLVTRRSNFGSYSGNAPPTPVTRNIKPSVWCFPPPGNQWLVSVMSPSEGLVYKPYTGPCPPTAGFVAPFYGSCGPVSLTPAGGDFLSTVYGVRHLIKTGLEFLSTVYGVPVKCDFLVLYVCRYNGSAAGET
ncbi:hypothetical protein Q3G72_006207 [Acer saccharum]|nr:hypothetical protein Q3G72_006207 [Acer saccharum]